MFNTNGTDVYLNGVIVKTFTRWYDARLWVDSQPNRKEYTCVER